MTNFDSPSQMAKTDRLTLNILEAVAEAEKRALIDLPPIYDAVNSDALEALVQSGDTNLIVEFTYIGYQITVYGTGEINVTDRKD